MGVGSTSAFRPTGTVELVVGLASTPIALAGGGDTIVVTNAAEKLAFVKFGADADVTADKTDMPILPNSRAVLSVNSLITHAAGILVSGSGTMHLTRGDGSFI